MAEDNRVDDDVRISKPGDGRAAKADQAQQLIDEPQAGFVEKLPDQNVHDAGNDDWEDHQDAVPVLSSLAAETIDRLGDEDRYGQNDDHGGQRHLEDVPEREAEDLIVGHRHEVLQADVGGFAADIPGKKRAIERHERGVVIEDPQKDERWRDQ